MVSGSDMASNVVGGIEFVAAVRSDVDIIASATGFLAHSQPSPRFVGFDREDKAAKACGQISSGDGGAASASLATANSAKNQQPLASISDAPNIRVSFLVAKINQAVVVRPFKPVGILDLK